MDTVEYRECVITHLTRRGNGKETPIRIIDEVWVRNGDGTCTKIAEYDPCASIYDHAAGTFREGGNDE